MALRYWVGGSGTWNTTSTTNWSATSGGPGGASAPTAADDVIFNSASSGVSYVVTCANGVCQSITTSAPATGTLSFNDPSFLSFFTVYSGGINIHAACLFTSTGTISHLPQVDGTYTTTFNGSGTNTLNVNYLFSSLSTGVSLNFCNSTTSSFGFVQLLVRGTLTCTNAAITVTGTAQSSDFGPSAAAITMTGTTINAGTASLQVSTVNIGGGATTSWAISTLNINVRNTVSFGSQGLYVGQGASTQPSAMGAVTFTDGVSGIYKAFFTRATTVTLTNINIDLVSNLTTTGALTINTGCNLINTGYTVSIGGTTTLAGTARYQYNNNAASTTFVGAVTVADGGIFYDLANPIQGSLTFSAGITLTPTGSNTALLLADTIVATAISATNTYINANSITVNGGVGRAFSFTVNASAGTGIFGGSPGLAFGSMSINTSTCSIVGVPSKRVYVNFPLSGTNPSLRPLSITGSTPTLTDVSFFGTIINGGGSNFSGTRLGTDGLSSGFLPQTPSTKFLVLPSSGTFVWNTASIWALTSGGATSANNVPLPQDTVQIDGNTGGAGSVITCSDSIFIKTFNRVSAASSYTFNVSGGAMCLFGDFLADVSGATLTMAAYLWFLRSGDTNRYIRTRSTVVDFSPNALTFQVDVGAATTVNIGGSSAPNFNSLAVVFTSGNIIIDSGTSFGPTGLSRAGSFGVQADATISSGEWTATATSFGFDLGATVTTSNYTVNLHDPVLGSGATYVNSATATARNGRIVIRASTARIFSGASTATNPFVSITVQNSINSPTLGSFSTEGDLYLQDLINAATACFANGFGPQSIYKTNGGTVYFQKGSGALQIQNLNAPQPNTFYTNGTLFSSTGWNSGSPPASPPSGNFLIF